MISWRFRNIFKRLQPRYIPCATVVATVALAVSTVVAQDAAIPSRLSDEAIVEAIRFGTGKAEPKPARIGKRAALIKSAMVYELGQLYTPRMRVALAARAAQKTYRTFALADVTDDMASDLLLFVVPPAGSTNRLAAVEAETVLVLPKKSKDPAQALRPLWTKTDTAAYQNGFGARWEEHTIVAAFDRRVLAPGLEFVVVYRNGDELRGELVDAVQ